MKLRILLMACFLVPFVVFSQQNSGKDPVKKGATKVGVIKNSYQTQQTHSQRPNYKYSDEYRVANGIPDDFPRFVNTGNSKQDYNNYYLAKQLWINNNPTRFEKIKHLSL